MAEDGERAVRELFEKRGLAFSPHLMPCADLEYPKSAVNLTRLLLRPEAGGRPDALLITDDNLVDHALAGLVAEGLRVPDDVEVVAHCNFPCPLPSVLNVRRLGFDADAVLTACIRVIDQQRAGAAVPQRTPLLPMFAEELSAGDPTVAV
jgi:hypothetical protein